MVESATRIESDIEGARPPHVSQGVWGRRTGESRQAYHAFQVYLGLGADRALRQVADRVGCHVSLIKRWSPKHDWRARALAWDESQRHQTATQVRADYAAYERRLRNAEQLEKVAMAGLRSLLVRDPETGELRFDRRLKPTEIASLIRVACHMMPTPIPTEDDSGDDDSPLSDLSDADLMRLRSLLHEERTNDDTEATEADEQDPAQPPGDGGGDRGSAP